jgi:energy-coupling factor transport system permease protein
VTARRPHAVALIVASAVPALALVWSVDPWMPIFLGVPLLGFIALITPKVITVPSKTSLIVLTAAVGTAGIASLLYGTHRGAEIFHWGLMHISEGSIATSIAAMLRILAIALPALLVAGAISAHEVLATCAVKRILPDRVALATLIALRLIPVISSDLDETRQARRANGRASTPFAVALTTLVIAIRRAVRMSDVAEIRGFSRSNRSWSVYRPLGIRDWILITGSVVIGVSSMILVAYLGVWNSAIA